MNRIEAEAHPFVRDPEFYLRGGAMPLVRISLREGKTEEYKKALADGVHRALVEAMDAPAQDRFQAITEHPAGCLIYDPTYLGLQRTDNFVMVQITLSTGRKLAQKRKLFKRMAEILAEKPGLRPQDLMVNLVEVAWENWSFGNGEAQYTV
jgi:4-oxalocrotonate tautomerase